MWSQGKFPAHRCTVDLKMTFSEFEPKLNRGDGVGGASDGGSNGGNVVM